MKKELKEKWIKALKSGEYQQATGSLHNENGFCCLGVLCDIQGVNWVLGSSGRDYGVPDPKNIPDICYGMPPTKYADGLYDFSRSSMDGSLATTLSDMNDLGTSFSDIADFIEKEVPVDE